MPYLDLRPSRSPTARRETGSDYCRHPSISSAPPCSSALLSPGRNHTEDPNLSTSSPSPYAFPRELSIDSRSWPFQSLENISWGHLEALGVDNSVGRVRVALEGRRTSLDDFDIETIKKINSPISFETTFHKLKIIRDYDNYNFCHFDT